MVSAKQTLAVQGTTLATSESSQPRKVGRYVLGNRLGRGGMAEVFSGYALGSHGFKKPVAVKRLLPELAHDGAFVERLIAEAKLQVGMQHSNIVSVLDLARETDDVFLVMEYVDGPSLRQLFKGRGARSLSLAISTYIIQAAATGLEYAHARPEGAVIHSDVSPSNILISTSGEVRVADFGIARRDGGAAGVIEGKWAYMAPEQARGERLTAAADVYALGVVLYELITGRHPFATRVMSEREQGRMRVVPPSTHNAEIPSGIDALCMKALADEPGERFQRMQHMIDALIDERFQHGWRADARDLANVVRKLGPADALAGDPRTRTEVTARPLTLHTRSLLLDELARASGEIDPEGAKPLARGSERAMSPDADEIIAQGGRRLARGSAMVPRPAMRPVAVQLAESAPTPRSSEPPLPLDAPRVTPSSAEQPALLRTDVPAAARPSESRISELSRFVRSSVHAIEPAPPNARRRTVFVLTAAMIFGVIAGVATELSQSSSASADDVPLALRPPSQSSPAPSTPQHANASPLAATTDESGPSVPTIPEVSVTVPEVPNTVPTVSASVDAAAPPKATDPAPPALPQPTTLPAQVKHKRSSAAPARTARLRVNLEGAASWAIVRVGDQRGEVPGAKFELASGRHQVRVTNPGYPALVCPVTLAANRTITLTVDIAQRACELRR